MSRIVSICIPTLNRAATLCQALRSIFSAEWDGSRVEICISNNASDEDYEPVIRLIESAPSELVIHYVEQAQRLPVDEHMLAVKNLATAPYIYFLGDDDYFLDGQLKNLLPFIDAASPDLAIFNGVIVDGDNNVLSSHFKLPSRRYGCIEDAFDDLRDKGMFGAVLVRSRHLNDQYFKALIGTAHGYGCYWFSLIADHLSGQTPTIIIPDFPLVALRMAAKTYDRVDVHYRDIPYELSVYQRHMPPGLPQRLNDRFRTRYLSKVSSLRFLTQLRQSGSNVRRIKDIDPAFYRRHRLAILASDLLVRSGSYEFARRLYRTLRAYRQIAR